ncbi:MAG: ABC transporter permease [Chloroflexi bacterium]|nr:ABC transporter permease [Chloroflexota bacterium]
MSTVSDSQPNPPTPSKIRYNLQEFLDGTGGTVLYFIAILLCLIGAWEGAKFIGQETDYQFELGPIKINLSMTRDLNMPHLKDIAEALSKPSQRQGPPLIEILVKKATYTLRLAIIGFAIGTTIGLALAILFAHSRLLERGLMPYVVASQTVPILALAPMVIIWSEKLFGSREIGMPMITAYLAFFPVTIYTLRGLSDVPPTALELMKSYAATRREILWKLRFPNAVPYIFTALKITAPASVVGTIIAELPTGIQDGLGGAIINFAQYYISGPARLWATNFVTAMAGILFFVTVAFTEWLVIRWKRPSNRLDRWIDTFFKYLRHISPISND